MMMSNNERVFFFFLNYSFNLCNSAFHFQWINTSAKERPLILCRAILCLCHFQQLPHHDCKYIFVPPYPNGKPLVAHRPKNAHRCFSALFALDECSKAMNAVPVAGLARVQPPS